MRPFHLFLALMPVAAFSESLTSKCLVEGKERYWSHLGHYERGAKRDLEAAKARFPIQVRDRAYRVTSGQVLMATSFEPVAIQAPGVAILQVHGGGWIAGARTQLSDYSAAWAGMGAAVYSIDYRLAPAHRFPAALEDLQAAILWVKSLHPGKPLFLFGFSAGANLAALAALTGSRDLAGVIAFAGRMDLTVVPSSIDYAPVYIGASRAEDIEKFKHASPYFQVPRSAADVPPMLFIHQLQDPQVDYKESCKIWDRLRAVGSQPKVMLIADSAPRHGPVGLERQVALQAVSLFIGLY